MNPKPNQAITHALPRAMRQLASACKGLSLLPGGLCSARRHNKTNESLGPFCRDGSGLPPPPATSARSRRIFLTLIPHLERCAVAGRTACRPDPQQAVDATIVSPVTRACEAQPGAAVQPGKALEAAARRKRRQTYPELLRAPRCRLVVVGVEVSGHFGNEAATWLRVLEQHKSSAVPAELRPAARSAWVARWSGLLAGAAQRAFAATLFEPPLARECNVAGGMRLNCTRSLPTCAGSSPYHPAVRDHADVPAVPLGACRGVIAGDQTLRRGW